MTIKKKTSNLKIFLYAFVIATFFGLMMMFISVTTELATEYNKFSLKDIHLIVYPMVDELSASYAFWLLIPLMIFFFKRVSLTKETFFRHFPLYLLFSIVIGLTHTGMMWASRSLLYPAFGLGDYNYGYMPFRLIMEYIKQFGFIGVVFVIYTLIKTYKEKESQQIRTAQLEEQLTKARLEALKMQINPHFLFNTLNMISSAMYDDVQAADKMLVTLSDLLRITLKSSDKGLNSLEKEVEILDLYIDIMKARFKDKLTVIKKIEENTLKALIPNFLFQPLIENSIKYGMENLTSTQVEIQAKRMNNNLVIQIKDNGPGIHQESQQVLNSGLGLSNTIERLDKLYGSDYDLNWINQKEGGLLLTIEMPFREEEETSK